MVHKQAAAGRSGDSSLSSSQSNFPHAAAGWELCSVLRRSEVLDAARNTVRIKVCYIMIALTLLGCLAMVITGKEAAKKDHTLLRVNEEKKAKWRAEAEKDQEAAAVKAQ
uniref:Family with sequence similarity 162 member B n=1 Tax=Pavo cristatus TaxID=9049 RepID=A0A8C9EJ20_PAVCR